MEAPIPAGSPHRGATVLTLGACAFGVSAVSFVTVVGPLLALPVGVAAWVMGGRDLAAMDAGTMDATGRPATRAGRVLGILTVVAVGALLVLVSLVLAAELD